MILSVEGSHRVDRRGVEELGIPEILLMENASLSVVAAMEERFGSLEGKAVMVLCGPGNNGGDGFALARHLLLRRARVETFLVSSGSPPKGAAKKNLEILKSLKGPRLLKSEGDLSKAPFMEALKEAELVVDALFGTGFRGALRGIFFSLTEILNRSGLPVIAVDIPSGLSGDDPNPTGTVVQAVLTVALHSYKRAHLLPPAEDFCGELTLGSIGLPKKFGREESILETLSPTLFPTLLSPRLKESHKGSYGHLLVVGGSKTKPGAAWMTSSSALRSGVGLVTWAAPPSAWENLPPSPEVMLLPLRETKGEASGEDLDALLASLSDKSAVVVGPGLGLGRGAQRIVEALLTKCSLPLVVDADALTLLGLQAAKLWRPGVVYTPHPGEFLRISGAEKQAVERDRWEEGKRWAEENRLWMVLKGHRTLAALPPKGFFLSLDGNPGMAVGGSGDVLAGVLGALLARRVGNVPPEEAVLAGVYIHNRAGDLAAERFGQEGMTAMAIRDCLPEAFRLVKGER